MSAPGAVSMASLVLSLLCLSLGADTFSWSPEMDVVFLYADLSRVLNKVNERFLSVAIDSSLLAEEKFMYLLSSQKLRTLAKALTPGFLRFGGTKQDFMVFTPHKFGLARRSYDVSLQSLLSQSSSSVEGLCEALVLPLPLEKRLKRDWAEQEIFLQKEEIHGNFQKVRFSEDAVDLLYSFANCSGFDLIFGLNAVLRTKNNSWDSHNAETLLSYCESKQYVMSWELGNEPNSFEKKANICVDGYQLGLDFLHLREILKKSKLYYSAGLYGPDIGQPKEDRKKYLLPKFLETAAKAINACTWHHYYMNGREASIEDFLSPQMLDTLGAKISIVLQTVALASPGKKVWLGETSSAYGGGAPGLSDTFVAGFMWLDKLGLAAKMGIDVVVRQALLGSGTYHLVNANLDPLPDYWLSVLYKRLVGPEVLDAVAFSSPGVPKRKLRVYLHCANKQSPNFRKGAVTLFLLNLSRKMVEIILPLRVNRSTIDAFVLEAGRTGPRALKSRSIRLNGVLLKMVDDNTLPPLYGVPLAPSHSVKVPGHSFAFYVLKDASVPVCW